MQKWSHRVPRKGWIENDTVRGVMLELEDSSSQISVLKLTEGLKNRRSLWTHI
jgi:hypothetical protein